MFAGVDPEFYVTDERESWRIQQDAMAAAVEALFGERPAAVRALIRGLSSFEFEEAVLSAYDAMRGAGSGVDEAGGAAPPPAGTRGRGSRSPCEAIAARAVDHLELSAEAAPGREPRWRGAQIVHAAWAARGA